METLHLMTQDGQPYGSTRKCCELCGALIQGDMPYCTNKKDYETVLDKGHKGERFKKCY